MKGSTVRTPLVAGNWKMNKLVAEAVAMVNALKPLVADVSGVDIVAAVGTGFRHRDPDPLPPVPGRIHLAPPPGVTSPAAEHLNMQTATHTGEETK